MMENESIIQLKNVGKQFRLYNSNSGRLLHSLFPFLTQKTISFSALEGINLEVHRGEIVGIIGRNGSGKSTLLRIVAGITQPTEGERIVKGKLIPMFELGTGFNRDLTGRENLKYFTIIQNFDKAGTGDIIEKAIAFADIGRFIDQPLRSYSRGMRARLAFSISIYLDADILVIDEVLGVGDAFFKTKSQEKMRELITSGKTILMVTHSEKEVQNICTRAVLLQKGKIVMDGKPEDVLKSYKGVQPKPNMAKRKSNPPFRRKRPNKNQG
jgi:ABC-type polysaccharide/polyol phosphate transport system ATPase subunit